MRILMGMITAVALVSVGGCGLTGPYASAGPNAAGGGGTGATTDSAPPRNAVTVSNIVFTSAHNGTAHPATDTVTAGSTMTWTWAETGQVMHSVQSIGATTFPSSALLAGEGSTYLVTFTTPGTYQYDCAVHGQAMTGTIVVIANEE
jgi:plastocyanin